MAQEIQQYFTSYRSPGWTAPVETVPQESTPLDPVPQIQPDGWVINSSANVFIDDAGLHIYDGAIFLVDAGGDSVLSPAGFEGSWVDFLEHGTYNGSMASGSLSSIVSATIVGTASTPEDYEASISADIPYWVIDSLVIGGGSIQRVPDADASKGFALQISGNADISLFQDAPVVPGTIYSIESVSSRDNSVGAYQYSFNVYYQFLEADRTPIGSEVSDLDGFTQADIRDPAYARRLHTYTTITPANARYVRVRWEIVHVSGTPDVRISDLIIAEASSYSLGFLLGTSSGIYTKSDPSNTFPDFVMNIYGTMMWGDGTVDTDVILSRPAADTLKLGDGDRWDAEYCGIGISRISAISVSTSSHTTMTFPSSFITAKGGTFSVASNHTITVDHDGLYDIDVRIEWGAGTASTRRIVGIGIDGETTSTPINRSEVPATGSAQTQIYSGKHVLTAGQTVKAIVFHNSGAAIDVNNGRFSVIRVGR